ncbi:MAG: DUF4236 domain-containing protein [Myxococcota bacterium]
MDFSGFRFWRRVKIAPGVTLNLSKSGASVSVGPQGAHVTVGTTGARVTLGLPGTGLFWTSKLGDGGSPDPARAADPTPIEAEWADGVEALVAGRAAEAAATLGSVWTRRDDGRPR